nr:ribonuclease H-like domain-containing protein [Tanacetum cinerariifolium]
MEQYLTHIDYARWEVIVNGDAPATIASISGGADAAITPKMIKQKIARKNELKAKNTLLLAIPDVHLLKFHRINDAKTLWEAIKTRFGGSLRKCRRPCTKHMTGNRRLFTLYKAYDGGHVVFGRNLKGKVVDGGNMTHDSITIINVEHFSGLAFNLISVVLNKETMRIEESLNVAFDEGFPEPKSSSLVEDNRIYELIVKDLNGSPSLQVNVLDEGYPKSLKKLEVTQ